MNNPKEIYLQPICPECDVELPGGDPNYEGRQWCTDSVWDSDCDGCGREVLTPRYVLTTDMKEHS